MEIFLIPYQLMETSPSREHSIVGGIKHRQNKARAMGIIDTHFSPPGLKRFANVP
jgi:hypothetical protein